MVRFSSSLYVRFSPVLLSRNPLKMTLVQMMNFALRLHFLRNRSNSPSSQISPLFAIFFRASQIRDFSIKILYKIVFRSLTTPKVTCKGDFQAYLLALSGNYCNSDPFSAYFLEIMIQIRDFSNVPYLEFLLYLGLRLAKSTDQAT